jgi:DNA-binding GntR family transcriptional regulator
VTSPVEILQPDARSQSEQAYYAVRELIVTLELPPGSLVDERELMDRLGLGRTPVREALRALAQAHLIEVYPRRGMFVAPADARDLASLSEVRCVLEPFAARLAA